MNMTEKTNIKPTDFKPGEIVDFGTLLHGFYGAVVKEATDEALTLKVDIGPLSDHEPKEMAIPAPDVARWVHRRR